MFQLNNVKYKNILNINNLHIPQNKITCIVGQSGSGKSTLLKLLNNLISCDSGEILYNNISLDDIDPITLRREVSMLGQSYIIFPGNIKDNLLIGLRFSEKDIVDDLILKDILKTVNLNKNLDDNTDNLSGGEKQRLALARVILLDPKVFLLDEPSSAMDEDTEEIIIKNIVNISKKENKTLIMVTHSKKIAQKYSENIIEISKGEIIASQEEDINE